jgi:hypothetical protein
VAALLARGQIREDTEEAVAEANDGPDRILHDALDGNAVVLRITEAGRAAIEAMGDAASPADVPAPTEGRERLWQAPADGHERQGRPSTAPSAQSGSCWR